MTRGIISSIRSIPRSEGAPIEDAIQTDARSIRQLRRAAAEFACRGDRHNTMIASNGAEQSSGIWICDPDQHGEAVLADLTRYGKVKRPSLGLFLTALDLIWPRNGAGGGSGVLIQKVVPGAPADRAGLKEESAGLRRNMPIMLGGDLIVAWMVSKVTDPTISTP